MSSHSSISSSSSTSDSYTDRLRRVLWRDVAFLLVFTIGMSITGYVESHPHKSDSQQQTCAAEITDAGFQLTLPLYNYLLQHRDLVDWLALSNSLLFLVIALYVVYNTHWQGDYTLALRILLVQLFRSFCGYFTNLPPSPQFVMSFYDFPEILYCLGNTCSAEQNVPFVSFFSGHVATMVVTANHMYAKGHVKTSIVVHIMNILQIVRLLATRGHYSIDLIIGYVVAVYVPVLNDNNTALGRLLENTDTTTRVAAEIVTSELKGYSRINTMADDNNDKDDDVVYAEGNGITQVLLQGLLDKLQPLREYLDRARNIAADTRVY